MENLDYGSCYCTSMRRSVNMMSDYYDAALKETGLTISQYRLLVHLKRLGRANITRWSQAVGLERSTMVRNVHGLESRQLIERAEGYGKVYILSERGKHALDDAEPVWEMAQRHIEEYLGEDAAVILRIEDKLRSSGFGK